jgi:hypothetical protein
MTLHPAHGGKTRLAHPALKVLDAVVDNPHVGLQTVLATEGQLATIALSSLGIDLSVIPGTVSSATVGQTVRNLASRRGCLSTGVPVVCVCCVDVLNMLMQILERVEVFLTYVTRAEGRAPPAAREASLHRSLAFSNSIKVTQFRQESDTSLGTVK